VRLNADAVLREDGSVEEAIPGAHGKDILKLEDSPPGTDARLTAASLYEGGVRQLVLAGGLAVAAPFLAAGLVDQVLAYLPHGKASRRPGMANPWPLLPPGFAIRSARKLGEYVQIEGQPEKAR
jgi:diaminohydroxyphosphoribosylaminopyrimidine deaminase / 5-amino-6-(5-phosphoribosylamino)uracil reductase